MKKIQPHLSLNGIPGTLWEIRRQENVHPYLGLRQAILIINAQERALMDGRLSKKKLIFKLNKQKEEFLITRGEEAEILKDEIDIAEYELQSFDQLILDAETELRVAKEEKERIEALNCDLVGATYEELQQKYASEAFQRKLAKAIVVSAYSSQKMISEGAAEVIYDSVCFSEAERMTFDMDVVRQLKQWLPREEMQAHPNQFLESTNGGTNGTSTIRN
jgi:hypothetical protein